MNTASPLDNQEKSVANSAVSLTAFFKRFSVVWRATPARKTDASGSGRTAFFKEDFLSIAFVVPGGTNAEARLIADAFRNVLLSITMIPLKTLFHNSFFMI